jgi:hypothetical protein
VIADNEMRIEQDGTPLGSSSIYGSAINLKDLRKIRWGHGAYGIFTGNKITESTSSR